MATRMMVGETHDHQQADLPTYRARVEPIMSWTYRDRIAERYLEHYVALAL